MLSLKFYFTTGFLPSFEAEICDQYLNIHLSEAVLDFNLVGYVKFGFHPKIMCGSRISARELYPEDQSGLRKLCPQ